ncbi:uncharacterized protein LOC142629035 [Castanea sativa]|uniref:uncharacterized protein LOC142629035 n=1 Tax=Castanea sativa TaxID=21020 RepID=UPI003F64FE56
MSNKIVVKPVVAQTNMNFVAVNSELNLVGRNTKEWWMNTGATRHVYSEKKMFSIYNPVGNEEKFFMGNSSTSKIEGNGKTMLKMTTDKFLTLKNVLHVPEIQTNIVSDSLLSKNGFKLVFESDKFSLFKSGIYCYVYLLRSKDEAIKAFMQYKNEVENQLNKKIKVPRSDRRGECESPFGVRCLTKVVVPIPKRIKLRSKSVDCVFIGYAHNSSAYRFLIHKSDIPDVNANTIIESRNAVFFEEIFPYKSTQVSSSLKRNFKSTSNTSHDQELMEERNEVDPRRNKRAKMSKSFGSNFLTYMLEDEPQSFKEAISTPEAPFWKEVVNSNNNDIIKATKRMLTSEFDMKDLGVADVILGMKISRKSNGLVLSQSHYVKKVIKKFKKYDDSPMRTPINVNLHLTKNKGQGISQWSIRERRPLEALVRVLRYLRYTLNYGLHYTRYPAVLEGYSDANWISDTKDTKSMSGYVFTLGGAAVSWKPSKQTCIAKSTMESEFIALDKVGEEAEWLRHFLEDMPMWIKLVPPICIHCDSKSAIGRAQIRMYNAKSRHIRRRHNTVRQLLSNETISIDLIEAKENIVDP